MKMTKIALARELGLSERRVHAIFENGTTSRERAEEIAAHYGGEPEDYLRAPRPRGRERDLVAWFRRAADGEFTFKDFVRDYLLNIDGGIDPAENAIANFDLAYSTRKDVPSDFDKLESLIAYMRAADYTMEQRDTASLVWQRFLCWQVDRVAALTKYEIEDGDF